ncbi:MAG: SUF system NifU family Fe-S cluster assembly protein [Rhodocyclaceae bacterium]|jgi:nitrogen fixation NifU-like protein|nr:SUF system NifU family Fe-S cluster assembly protein [Rhodocyclaceae bacterium]
MSDLRDLYQEVIFDHYKHPRNFHRIEGADRVAEGYNPLCGDTIKVFLKVENGIVADVGFEGCGCAISTASASLMTEAVKGRTVAEAERLFGEFHAMITDPKEPAHHDLGKLEVLCGVKEFPTRVKCATLAWHTLHNALEGKAEPVSTE